jgi:putative oxidoreductase
MPESSQAPRSDAEKIDAFPPRRGAQWPCPAPEIFSVLGAAATLETIGGALLIIGLFTWPVAFFMSGLMAFAHFIADAPRSFWPVSNGGDSAILFCLLFLYLVFAAPGPWSLVARKR